MDSNDKNQLSDDMPENVIGGFMLIPYGDPIEAPPVAVSDFTPDGPPHEPAEPIFPDS